MKKFAILIGILWAGLLAACGGDGAVAPVAVVPTEPPAPVYVANMVDERLELVLLVQRLAGVEHLDERATGYQLRLHRYFDDFADHPAVAFAAMLEADYAIGMPQGAAFAANLARSGDGFDLLDEVFGWDAENARHFADLLGDFYTASNFGEFFDNNMEYFLQRSLRFYEVISGGLNMEWMAARGANPENMRLVISPSIRWMQAEAHVEIGGEIIFYSFAASIMHGWNPPPGHAANVRGMIASAFLYPVYAPLALQMLDTNPDFRRMVENSVNQEIWPGSTLEQWATEYLRQSFGILYQSENDNDNPEILIASIIHIFPYLSEIFQIIKE